MCIIDVSSGYPQACCEKATEKLAMVQNHIKDLSFEEKYQTLKHYFDLFAKNTQKCLDNFDSEEFVTRKNDEKPEGELSCMMQGAIQGVLVLRGLKSEMEQSALSRVNGTAYDFARCSNKAIVIEEGLEKGLDVYNREMQRRLQHAHNNL